MQQFPNAQHLMITGGDFSQTQNVYGTGKDTGLHILEKYIAADAIYDSAERYPPAQCLPGTRDYIIETIMEWINAPSPEKQALWLHGSAGAGKSAVGHSIAARLKDRKKYASSFFFAKGAPGRGDGNKLFATIAYELAMNFPEYRAVLNTVMQENPTLPTKSINIQLHNLLIRPLKKVRRWPSHHPTIIVDGLDECAGGKRMHGAILSTISNAIVQHGIPLRFLIISRPEYWIADAFETGCFSSVVQCLSLRDDLYADAGIKFYLCHEFDRIYDENIELMHSVSRPWPKEHIIKRFVNSASGQFIYASTVVTFVGDSLHCNPLDQLRILTTTGPHEASAFSELDSLYAAILSSYPRWDSLKRVLIPVIMKCAISEAVMEQFFGIPPAELYQILRSMRPLIYKRKTTSPPIFKKLEPTFGSPLHSGSWLSFHHVSFMEFITDRSRSGRFVVDRSTIEQSLWSVFIRHLSGMLQGIPDVEQIMTHIGMSQHRYLLTRIPYVIWPNFFEDIPRFDTDILIQELKGLHEALEHLTQTDGHIHNASHAVWPLSTFDRYLYLLVARIRGDNLKLKKRFNPQMKLIFSLSKLVETAFTMCVQQVLGTTPIDGPIFGYLFTRGWEESDTTFDIESIGQKDRTDDAILSELQALHGIVSVRCDEGKAEFTTLSNLFQQIIYEKMPSVYLNSCRFAELESKILADMSSLFIGVSNHTIDTNSLEFSKILTFLQHPGLSDMCSHQRLRDSDRITIFNTLIGPYLPQGPEPLTEYMRASLDWFTRQLTGPNRRVIEESNNTLTETMEAAAKAKFSALLPLYVQASSHDIHIPGRCFSLKRHATHLAGKSDDAHVWSEDWDIEHGDIKVWDTLKNLLGIASENHHIVPLDLYPHLSSMLLKALAADYYSILHPDFPPADKVTVHKNFQQLVQWMPYAIPTEDNLNMIRVMQHLWYQIDQENDLLPPVGFCNLTMEFLTKFNASMLLEPERRHLNFWLVKLRDTESPTHNYSMTLEESSD